MVKGESRLIFRNHSGNSRLSADLVIVDDCNVLKAIHVAIQTVVDRRRPVKTELVRTRLRFGADISL